MKVAPGSEHHCKSLVQSEFQVGLTSKTRKHLWPCVTQLFVVLTLTLAGTYLRSQGAPSELPPTLAVKAEETNSPETLRSYLQLQEQLHSTQLAIEESM